MHQSGTGTVRAIAPVVAAGVTIAGVQAVATAVVPEPAVRTLIQLVDAVQPGRRCDRVGLDRRDHHTGRRDQPRPVRDPGDKQPPRSTVRMLRRVR